MAKIIKVEELGIKKTMLTVATAMVNAKVAQAIGDEKWQTIVDAMKPADGSTSSTPREVTILKDEDGNQLGRKCSVTGLWFANDKFNKGTTCVKLADSAKGKLYTESKVMEKDAMSLMDEARELTDVAEKVAKFEAYDKKLLEAKAHRATPVTVTEDMQKGGVETIEVLAKQLGVEVNPVKAATEEA